MTDTVGRRTSIRVLEPIERISEVLFGLIMVLTFTGSLSAAESGEADVRAMLIGALGCNLAWGLIDAIMYLMAGLADSAGEQRTLVVIRRAKTDKEAEDAIVRALPPFVAPVLTSTDLTRIRAALSRVPASGKVAAFRTEDWLGAAAVFILVFVFTLPVVLPFIILDDAVVALRFSNAIAVAMMFVAGYAFGRVTGHRPWVMAGSMVVLGCILVALTIALGG